MGLSYIGRYNRLSKTQRLAEFTFSTDYNFSTIVNLGNKNKLNVFYKYVGKLPSFSINENNVLESYTDAYKLLDISINRRITDLFVASLGGKNLLNITNIRKINDVGTIHSSSNNSLPISYGRTFFLRLNFNL